MLLLCSLIFFFYYYTSTLEFELDEFYEYVSREEYLNSKEYEWRVKHRDLFFPLRTRNGVVIVNKFQSKVYDSLLPREKLNQKTQNAQ